MTMIHFLHQSKTKMKYYAYLPPNFKLAPLVNINQLFTLGSNLGYKKEKK